MDSVPPSYAIGYELQISAVGIILNDTGPGFPIAAEDFFRRKRLALFELCDFSHCQFRLTESVAHEHGFCGNRYQFIGVSVTTDETRYFLAGGRVDEVNDPTEIAILHKIGFVNLGEFVAHEILIELGIVVNEVRNYLHIAVVICAKRKPGFHRIFLACEIHGKIDRFGLSVVKHFLKVATLFECLAVDAPFLFEVSPVDFAFVNRLKLRFLFRHRCFLLRLRLFFGSLGRRLLGLFSRLCRLLLIVLRSLRKINLVVLQHVGVGNGVFCEIPDYCTHRVIAVCGNAEESECGRVLALADEV